MINNISLTDLDSLNLIVGNMNKNISSKIANDLVNLASIFYFK